MPGKAHSFKVRFPFPRLFRRAGRAGGFGIRFRKPVILKRRAFWERGCFLREKLQREREGKGDRNLEKNTRRAISCKGWVVPFFGTRWKGPEWSLKGNREVVLEDCRGILEYDTDVVRVRAGKLIVRFTGRGLTIKCMTADSMVVEGFITGMEFMV